MAPLWQMVLLDALRGTSAMAALAVAFDCIVTLLRLRPHPPVAEHPRRSARKWLLISIFGMSAGASIFLRDRVSIFADGTVGAQMGILIAWIAFTAAICWRAVSQAERRMFMAGVAGALFIALLAVSIMQRGV